jgi:hypothetical protein
MNKQKNEKRRGFLKGLIAIPAGFALSSLLPAKILNFSNNDKIKVSIHPLAVKREKRG